jgi:beta-galactosidase GanA
MVRNNSHNWDLMADDAHREARGLISASLTARGGKRFAVPIAWRIQGNDGGEAIADMARGPLNNGGLFGERAGWHLPGAPDSGWARVGAIATSKLAPGVTWYRNQFRLSLPTGQDVSVGLRFAGAGATGYRALVFLNGWQVGHYIDAAELQHEFVLPAGILRQRGNNSLAIAVIAPGELPGGPGAVSLAVLGNQRGGVAVEDVASPGHDGRDRD